jgi:hypothetical protein
MLGTNFKIYFSKKPANFLTLKMSASNSPLADAFGKALEYEALFRYYDKKEPHLFDSCPFFLNGTTTGH